MGVVVSVPCRIREKSALERSGTTPKVSGTERWKRPTSATQLRRNLGENNNDEQLLCRDEEMRETIVQKDAYRGKLTVYVIRNRWT